jgi:hypothetical protein
MNLLLVGASPAARQNRSKLAVISSKARSTGNCGTPAVTEIGAGQFGVADQVRAQVHRHVRFEAEEALLAAPGEARLGVFRRDLALALRWARHGDGRFDVRSRCFRSAAAELSPT